MAGIGEAIGAIGLIEPFLHACLRSYGLYKLTRDFGEDYHKAERRLQGQRARLKVLSETKTRSIVTIPEDGTVLGATVVSTLQGMKTSFEKCETLMRKYGNHKEDLPPAHTSNQSVQQSQDPQETRRTLSPTIPHKISEPKSKSVFRRSFSKSPSPSDSSTTSDTIGTSTNASSTSSIRSPKVTEGSLSDRTSAISLQQASSIWGRMKWAVEDREEFLSAVESLTRDNDLLESLLRIKSSNDPTFLPDFSTARTSDESFVASTKTSLKQLHHELLMMNSKTDISFSVKLSVHEDEDKNVYEDYINSTFMKNSKVHLLQAHSASKHSESTSSFLLAENSIFLDETSTQEAVPSSSGLEDDLLDPDPNTRPPFQALARHGWAPQSGSDGHRTHVKVTLFQDRTSSWQKTDNLDHVLQDSRLHSIYNQQSYTQLALLAAFCYAALSFTYLGKPTFPQANNFGYYDHAVAKPEAATHDVESPLDAPPPKITLPDENLAIENEQLQFPDELLSPWYNFHFGSRPLLTSTRLFGKRRGINSANSNPVVALGIVLFQIGSWCSLSPDDDIGRLRLEALGRYHEVVRLSGVEFAEITRACLNWIEIGPDGKRYDCEEMLVKVYSKLNAYNSGMQR